MVRIKGFSHRKYRGRTVWLPGPLEFSSWEGWEWWDGKRRGICLLTCTSTKIKIINSKIINISFFIHFFAIIFLLLYKSSLSLFSSITIECLGIFGIYISACELVWCKMTSWNMKALNFNVFWLQSIIFVRKKKKKKKFNEQVKMSDAGHDMSY